MLSELSGLRGDTVMEAFVGFYRTLPVNWLGFRSLRSDVEAAAAKSRTIHYQRALVQNWVRDHPPDGIAQPPELLEPRRRSEREQK
jgi:hypothetical protein